MSNPSCSHQRKGHQFLSCHAVNVVLWDPKSRRKEVTQHRPLKSIQKNLLSKNTGQLNATSSLVEVSPQHGNQAVRHLPAGSWLRGVRLHGCQALLRLLLGVGGLTHWRRRPHEPHLIAAFEHPSHTQIQGRSVGQEIRRSVVCDGGKRSGRTIGLWEWIAARNQT